MEAVICHPPVLGEHVRWLTWNLRPLITRTLWMQSCSTGTVDMRLLNSTRLHLRPLCSRTFIFNHARLPAEHQGPGML